MAYISELVEYAKYESTYNGTLYFENTTLYNPSSAKYESRDAWSAEAGFSDFNFSSAYNTPVTKEDAMLIRLEEKPLFQSFIARELGYTKNDFGRSFPIDLFTNFLINQSPDRFEDVTRISKHIQPSARPVFAEAFLATEFGDDFGGTLVGLAETMDSEQLGLLLEKVANIRQ